MTTLYHVSPRSNRASILKSGVDPIWSEGKQDVIWLVDENKLLWAVAHCSARKVLSVKELDIHTVYHAPKLRRTAWKGVYTSSCRVLSARIMPADQFVESQK